MVSRWFALGFDIIRGNVTDMIDARLIIDGPWHFPCFVNFDVFLFFFSSFS